MFNLITVFFFFYFSYYLLFFSSTFYSFKFNDFNLRLKIMPVLFSMIFLLFFLPFEFIFFVFYGLAVFIFYEHFMIAFPNHEKTLLFVWGFILLSFFYYFIAVKNNFLLSITLYCWLVLFLIIICRSYFSLYFYCLSTALAILFVPALSLIFDNQLTFLKAVFIILFATQANDAFQYFFGKIFGKKYFNFLSPNKTYEGLFFGIIFSFLFTFLFIDFLFAFSPIINFQLSFLLIFFSSLSSIFSSFFKRQFNATDFGNILPGHGGISDRFNGLFLTSPVYFVYWFTIDKSLA